MVRETDAPLFEMLGNGVKPTEEAPTRTGMKRRPALPRYPGGMNAPRHLRGHENVGVEGHHQVEVPLQAGQLRIDRALEQPEPVPGRGELETALLENRTGKPRLFRQEGARIDADDTMLSGTVGKTHETSASHAFLARRETAIVRPGCNLYRPPSDTSDAHDAHTWADDEGRRRRGATSSTAKMTKDSPTWTRSEPLGLRFRREISHKHPYCPPVRPAVRFWYNTLMRRVHRIRRHTLGLVFGLGGVLLVHEAAAELSLPSLFSFGKSKKVEVARNPDLVKMNVDDVVSSMSGPVVVLRSDKGQLLPIWVGSFEAQAIERGVHAFEFPRPLTHDLFLSSLAALGGTLTKVHIDALENSTFIGTAYIRGAHGQVRTVDGRPSDLIALAVRAGVPIYARMKVLSQAAVSED